MTTFSALKNLKRVAENLPLISIVYFAFAYLYMLSYFMPFDIAVRDYYSYAEILFPLSTPLIIIGIFLLVFLMNKSLDRVFDKRGDDTASRQGSNDAPAAIQPKKPIRKIKSLDKWVLFIVVLLPLLFIVYNLLFKSQFTILSLICAYAIIGIVFRNPSFFGMLQFYRAPLMMLVVLLLFFMVFSARYWYGQMLVKKGATHTITAKHNDALFQSDKSNVIFVGTSDDYYLFYKKADSASFVLKRSEMDSITIKKVQSFDWTGYLNSGWHWN